MIDPFVHLCITPVFFVLPHIPLFPVSLGEGTMAMTRQPMISPHMPGIHHHLTGVSENWEDLWLRVASRLSWLMFVLWKELRNSGSKTVVTFGIRWLHILDHVGLFQLDATTEKITVMEKMVVIDVPCSWTELWGPLKFSTVFPIFCVWITPHVMLTGIC